MRTARRSSTSTNEVSQGARGELQRSVSCNAIPLTSRQLHRESGPPASVVSSAADASGPPPLFPLIGRRLTETAETMMLGMQARIASRATERSRAMRARQRRQERRQEQKAAKTLSAILLAFIVTWTPYNVFAIVQTFCPDCIHQHLYEFGQSTSPRTCHITFHSAFAFGCETLRLH